MSTTFNLGGMNEQELTGLKDQCTNQIAVINSILDRRDQTPDSQFQDNITEADELLIQLSEQENITQEEKDRLRAFINSQDSDIQGFDNNLKEKKEQLEALNKQIENKMKLIETRNRMLQVSIEKNNYKKKVIYTLISIILAIIIIMLVAYVYFNKKK
jgi:flagellar motility protein MotE (MotC chaperone)